MSSEGRQIVYEDRQVPVMAEGKYKLIFGQQVQVNGPDGKGEAVDYNQKEQLFEVKSENRFCLPATSIHSFYPPADASGDFTTHIAQITFMKDSIPWERPLLGAGIPWMCLILLDEEDKVQVHEGTLGVLFGSTGEGELYIPRMPGGDEKCEVRAVDLTREQLQAWLPTKNGLSYLAHIRQVNVEDKATHLYRTEGRFSNLICPRVPRKGDVGQEVRTQVHVVSLEGYEWFYGDKRMPGKECPRVRLLSLAKWEFTSVSQAAKGFRELSRELDVGILCADGGKANNANPLEEQMERMLKAGYFPMNHETREECRTISWYKGPFIPYIPEAVVQDEGQEYAAMEHQTCLNDSDGSLTYVQETDMLDASYAAAWQLGFLLGIRNGPFMEVLYAIRQRNYEADAYKKSWEFAKKLLDDAKAEEAGDILERLLSTGTDYFNDYVKNGKE